MMGANPVPFYSTNMVLIYALYPGMHGLTHLDISSTEVGDQGLAMLTRTFNFRITTLNTSNDFFLIL
jgi:hypothetical protein